MENSRQWYEALNKPEWAPDSAVFGQVWSVLYPIIFLVNTYIVYLLVKNRVSLAVALPFWLNLFFNLIFSPIQFILRNNMLALFDIILVLTTIIWAMIAIWPTSKPVALLFIPYLIWVSIATSLQFSITVKN